MGGGRAVKKEEKRWCIRRVREGEDEGQLNGRQEGRCGLEE